MSDAFFRRDGEAFVSTALTTGPWSPKAQHAGPPAALLARHFELAAPEMTIARMTFELLRPVPVDRLHITGSELRPGRRVRLLGASLWCGDTEVVRATALCLRKTHIDFDPAPAIAPQPSVPLPDDCAPMQFPFFQTEVGYHTAMELRCGRGGIGQGYASAWLRMRYPLVEGEVTTPLQRVAIAADSGNGVSAGLDWSRYHFINPDLTVHIHRLPKGEWVGLHAHTIAQPEGVGIADDQLHDEAGPIGRAVQTLLVTEA